MEIRFPEQRDEFPKTMLQFVVSVILALAVGLFLGNGLGALFGTDESVVNTSAYTDRMTAMAAPARWRSSRGSTLNIRQRSKRDGGTHPAHSRSAHMAVTGAP